MSDRPLTCEAMEPMGCGMPNCTHDHSTLYLNARCHTGRGVEVAYVKAEKLLRVRCRVCKKLVAEVAVAP